MRQAWGDFLRTARPRSHGVQVYAEPAELAESVLAFLTSGFELGEPAVVVAVPETVALVAEGLDATGWPFDGATRSGLLGVADAETMLAAFMDGACPSPQRFERTIVPLLEAAARPGRRVRVFGEMVDVLVRRNASQAADELEQLWNELAEVHDFSLLCGYRLDVFDRGAQARTLPNVCREHSHVLPARNYPRFARAVDEALREVLGPTEASSVYVRVSREADRGESGHVPLAQLLLMWVAQNRPNLSRQVLDTARIRYARAA